MKTIKKILFAIILLSIGTSTYAQNVNNLVGENAMSAENELERMGYKHINTSKSNNSAYANWWNERHQKCITVRVSNGEVKSVQNTMPADCNKSSSKSKSYNSYNDKYYNNKHDNHYSNNYGSTYKIRSRESGLVLDANMHSSEAVSIYRQHGGANQKWIVNRLGGNEVSIKNVGNGKALTVNSSSVVSLQSWRNSNNQVWYLEEISGNEYIIVSKSNSKVLDVSSGSHNMTTFKRNGSAHQKWILEKTY